MKKPRPSNPNATLKLRKQVHSSGFFRLAEEPKHRRLGSSKRLDDETSSTIKYIDTPNIEYMYRFEYIKLYLQVSTVLYQYFLYLFM